MNGKAQQPEAFNQTKKHYFLEHVFLENKLGEAEILFRIS